jgi:hypothetical protein
MTFLTELVLKDVDVKDDACKSGEGRWELVRPLVYRSEQLDCEITIPCGFVCDLASVPRLPLVWLYCGATAHRAAVVHDWGCNHDYYFTRKGRMPSTRKMADNLFLEAMKDTGVGPVRRWLMWAAVRVAGKING